MALTFPTTSLKKPSGVTALPAGFKRAAFGTLYGFDAQGGGGAAPAFNNEYSLSLDGTNDYMDVGTISALASSSDMTISGWFKGGSTFSGVNTVFSSGASASATERILLGPTSDTSIIYLSGASHTTVTVSSLGTTWHHLAFTLNGTSAKLYLDGSLVDSSTLGALGSVTFQLTRVGECNLVAFGSSNNFNGLIDEVAVWGSELSASDVTAIYNSGNPTDLTSLSPVGYWRMGDNDSGTGTTITDQGSGSNNGTLTNGPTFSSNVPVRYSTKSIDFDGTNDYLWVGDQTELRLTSNFSLSAWVKGDSFDTVTGSFILAKRDYGGATEENFQLVVYNTASAGYVYIGTDSASAVQSTSTISTGAWYHICATVNPGTEAKIYINGSLDKTSSIQAVEKSTAPLSIGGWTDNAGSMAGNFNGLIDEVAIFNSLLSASDVTAIYNGGQPADLTSLSPVGWWRMGDGTEAGSGTTVYDMSSNSNNGTLTNGPTYSSTTP